MIHTPRNRLLSLFLAALLGAALLSAACAEAALERLGLADASPLSIAFVVHGTGEDPFWHEVRAGAEAAGQAFDVSVSWAASPDTEESCCRIEGPSVSGSTDNT